MDAQALAAERGAERRQDQRQAGRRLGGDEPPGEPVQPGQLTAGRGVHGLPGDQRHDVVRVHLARRHLGDDPSVPQDDDPVREPEHLPGVVAGEQDRRALFAQPADQALDQGRFLHAQGGGRLVEQQHPRIVRHGPGDRHHLPLPAGQGLDRPRSVPQRDAEPVEQLGRVAVKCHVGEQVPETLVAEHDVRRDVEVVVQRDVLPDDAHAQPRGRGQIRRDRPAAQPDRSGDGGDVARDGADQRRLPGAVLPGERHELPGLHRQVDPVQCCKRTETHSKRRDRQFRRRADGARLYADRHGVNSYRIPPDRHNRPRSGPPLR